MTDVERRGKVVVVGQGYVGLPLAMAAVGAGYDVVGVDRFAGVVDALNRGVSHVGDVTSDTVAGALASGRYRATTETVAIADADVVLICVPTPYHDDAPDLSHVEGAAHDIGGHLKPGSLVILESTTYPGTTEELLGPILEERSGLRSGVDFQLVFSPERIDPGNERFGLRNTPKIVGGVTPEGTERAAEFYGSFVDTVVRVSTPRAAEMAKLLENTFRHINIALVNELAILARDMDIDVWEVIDAAASKPFGFMPFYPGPGVGGHCIPVDPMYLSWRVRQFGGSARFIELARDVNAAMPHYCIDRIQELLSANGKPLNGASILVLGVAYKADISDLRESPALLILAGLRERGALVTYYDPYVSAVALGDVTLESAPLDDAIVDGADCVVVLTAHGEVDHDAVARRARLVFDTRNVVREVGPSIHRL